MDELAPPRGAAPIRFGVFEFDARAGELRKRGVRLRIQQQPLRVLELLIAHRGEVVRREELRERLWPADTFVDFDHGLSKAVNKLRDALGDSAENPRFIETLAKRGYRFIAPVDVATTEAIATPPEAAMPAAQTPSEVEPPRVDPAPKGRSWATARAGAGVAAVAAALGIALALSGPRAGRPPARPDERLMLAVLPIVDLAGREGDAYFADGLTEELITELGQLNPIRLGVIARTSSMHYKGSSARIDEIARELGVTHVLEGTVRRTASKLRITARLVSPGGQTPLWSESYDRDAVDVLDVQSEVARRVAAAMAVELLPTAADSAGGRRRPAPDVYDTYLQGRFFWNRRTPADLERALSLLGDTVRRDPTYVPAIAALADGLNVLPWYGLRRPDQAYPQAKDLAARALALDDTSAAAHTAMAYAHHYYDWDWPAAEREYARALALNPNYAQAHQWRAAHEAELGRFDAALTAMRDAERLDPRASIIKAGIGWILYLARRYEAAAAQLERLLATDGDFIPARLWMAQVLEALGRPADGLEHLLRVRQLAGGSPAGLGELARGYAVAGRRREARAALAELTAIAASGYVEADLIARVHVALGDRDAAIQWVRRGLDERAAKMVLVGVDPQFDGIRADPRFAAIVTSLGLPSSPPR